MTTRTETALSFADVSKIYETFGSGQRYALHGVSFAAPVGRRIAIVGRSGSGKSTLLHLAAGIDVPTHGAVTILGQPLESLSEQARTLLRRDGVGLIFQFFYLLPHLSIRDNVALPALIAGEKPAAFEPRVTQLLARVGLGDRANDRVQKLSGGEMQRVAICRALLRRPKLLLADEPTGNLDDENGRLVMELMLSLVEEEGSTLIYVTHSRDFAGLADEIWQLQNGELDTRNTSPPARHE
ncbi:MAG: ABC transporter ATP-binding protein [Candidatus Tectomicrobia bacterium]|nr:ABC transporter ATP-binding protein [Candidatus Tectomicrobia bacterium]